MIKKVHPSLWVQYYKINLAVDISLGFAGLENNLEGSLTEGYYYPSLLLISANK